MDENEEYRNFFYESKKQGRYIVMDNSLHELGEAYNTARLLLWIDEIKPDEFIVPDDSNLNTEIKQLAGLSVNVTLI